MSAREKVRLKESKHPRYSHRVIYPGPDGKRLDRFFTNETEAMKFAEEKRVELGEVGESFGSISEDERAALAFWRAFGNEIGSTRPELLGVLRKAKDEWTASKGSVTVEEAVEKFLAHQEAGGASGRHLASLRSRLSRFTASHGKKLVSTITTGDFQDWLNGLRAKRADKEGEKLTTTTRINLSRSLRSFFNFAEERGWSSRNPVPAAKRSKNRAVKLAIHKAPEILLPADVARFMDAVWFKAPGLVPFWALKFFAGIRDSEAARLEWSMIDVKQGQIHLPAEVSKTGEGRSVKIEPNLAAWLRGHVKKSGRIVKAETTRKRGFKKVLAHLSAKGKAFVFPSNAARHCFGTYHLFHFRNAGETALQMGHKSNPAMLHEHYKNPTAEKHAGEFWRIYPGGKAPEVKAGKVVKLPTVRKRAAG